MNYAAILRNLQEVPSYTPPISMKALGEGLFLNVTDAIPDEEWPAQVRRGWFAMLRASGYASGNAHLVATGGVL
jgi:hypothetical protein